MLTVYFQVSHNSNLAFTIFVFQITLSPYLCHFDNDYSFPKVLLHELQTKREVSLL